VVNTFLTASRMSLCCGRAVWRVCFVGEPDRYVCQHCVSECEVVDL
jgi:hypothetical protein